MATNREMNTEAMTGRMPGEAAGQAKETMRQAQEKAKGFAGRMRGRASNLVESGKSRAAGSIQRAGDRLDQRANQMELKGGLQSQAGKAMHRAGDVLEGGANYLRTHEIGTIRDDVSNQIREHPFASVGLALGTGFVVGRLFGGEEEEEEERLEQRLPSPTMERGRGLGGDLTRQLGKALMGGVGSMVEKRMRGR